ncbi:RNAse P subunit P30 [Seiridium cupressi]
MLYDLNIAWSPSTSAAELTRTLKFSAHLGYNVAALNHTLSLPIPGKVTNPLPKFPPSGGAGPRPEDDGLPTLLTRCTVPVADSSIAHHVPRLVNVYDIIALRPTTEKGFQVACLNIEQAHLISLDLTQYLEFYFKPTSVMAAVNRGMRFEICYSQVLSADARGRATFIGNLMQLVRATKGRGLVVSSEARGVMGLRGPADVVNLLAVWGLSTEKATEGLGVNPRGVVVNEGIKRKGFRGVVEIVQLADKDTTSSDKMEGVEQEKAADKGETKGGQKRKGGDALGQADAVISRRKAKKLRKLAMLEGNPAETASDEGIKE